MEGDEKKKQLQQRTTPTLDRSIGGAHAGSVLQGSVEHLRAIDKTIFYGLYNTYPRLSLSSFKK
jgi:hypothetical protein